MAKELLGYSASALNKALDAGNFIEVKKDEK